MASSTASTAHSHPGPGHSGGERARKLEEHYLGLYKELKAAEDSREREELVRKVASFERELLAPPL